MDARYLAAGLVLLAACLGVHGAGWSNSIWAWGIPFALMLLFLGIVGQRPSAHVGHLLNDPNTEGLPSERPARSGQASDR